MAKKKKNNIIKVELHEDLSKDLMEDLMEDFDDSCRENDLTMILYLLDMGADPNWGIREACINGNLELHLTQNIMEHPKM